MAGLESNTDSRSRPRLRLHQIVHTAQITECSPAYLFNLFTPFSSPPRKSFPVQPPPLFILHQAPSVTTMHLNPARQKSMRLYPHPLLLLLLLLLLASTPPGSPGWGFVGEKSGVRGRCGDGGFEWGEGGWGGRKGVSTISMVEWEMRGGKERDVVSLAVD